MAVIADEGVRAAAEASVPCVEGVPVALVASAQSPNARTASPLWAAQVQPGLKRALDILISALILLALLPIMLVVVAAIVLESPGPVFYRADRVGRGGKRMRMFKFRKMRPDAGGLKLTTGNDDRLTRVGAFLTRTKLDELPQFINVLRGEMSLIGPRPEDPGFVIQRQSDYDHILQVRPGITGLSQIAFAEESRILSETDPLTHYLDRIFPQKCALDRIYVQSAGLRMDLRIFMWTLIAVVARRQVAVNRATGTMNLRKRDASEASTEESRPRTFFGRLRDHEAVGAGHGEPSGAHAPVRVRMRSLRLSFRRRPR
jgi:lipopolysaccharide/colanic/teichoic acid biosynthesis glycosyltransferase